MTAEGAGGARAGGDTDTATARARHESPLEGEVSWWKGRELGLLALATVASCGVRRERAVEVRPRLGVRGVVRVGDVKREHPSFVAEHGPS